MKIPRALVLALLLAAGSAATSSAVTVAEVIQSGGEYRGKIATLLLPQGWKKGTFDTDRWLDLKAPTGKITTKTLRFSQESLYSHSPEEFQRKVAAAAEKAGAPLQSALIDDIPFTFYVTPSKYQDKRVPGTQYDMILWADWPRREEPAGNEFRDAMNISILERPLLGSDAQTALKPEQVGELLRKGILPDVEIMAILHSIVFADGPAKRYHARFAAIRRQAQEQKDAAAAVTRLIAVGKLAGTWIPAELRVNGRTLTGAEMEEAAAGRLRTVTFGTDGAYRFEPRDETWKPDGKGGYTLGDFSGRLWVENNGLVNFRDADGYHFVFRKLPNEFPSDPELLAAAVGEWTPVELIAGGKDAMGDELERAARLARAPLQPLSVRADGTLFDGRKFGSWKLENNRFVMTFENYQFVLRGAHIENLAADGARVIYARQGEERRFKSVFMSELLAAEAAAAESEPLIGRWEPAGVTKNGEEMPKSIASDNYRANARPIWIRSDGTVFADGRDCGAWKNESGVYTFSLKSLLAQAELKFENGKLTRGFSGGVVVIYKKLPFALQ